jgi:hypothetical protein
VIAPEGGPARRAIERAGLDGALEVHHDRHSAHRLS